jgi:hypothetical protein
VLPVSLHTLLAAVLITVLAAMATLTWAPESSGDLPRDEALLTGAREPAGQPG